MILLFNALERENECAPVGDEIFSSNMLPFLSSLQKLSPDKVYHVVVAPCFDKKFEAVREEFYNSLLESRDVDCVLTSGLLLLI